MNENKELMAKIQQLISERRQYEHSNPNRKLNLDKPETSSSNKHADETSLKVEKNYEKSERTAKSEIYERQIRELTHENQKIRAKLVRSEKSRRFLKANTEKILESTHEILNETKVSDYTKTLSSRKKRVNLKPSSSRPEDQDEKSTQLQDLENSVAQEYYELTEDLVAADETYGESLSVHVNNTRIRSENMANDETFNVSTSSNFSDLLGEGLAEKLRNRVDELGEILDRRRTEQSQIIHNEAHKETQAEDTEQSGCITSSEVPASRAPSAMANEERHLRNQSRRRTITLNERDSTTVSRTSIRRHSVPACQSSIHIDQSKIEKIATDMKDNNDAKDRTHLSSSKAPKPSFHKSCDHQAQNCTICLCSTSDKDLQKPNYHIKVEKPIPVSNRIHITTPYGDDPTIRPSTSPGRALATVIKGLKEEIEHTALKYNNVHKTYMSHDASLGRKIRKGLSNSMKSLHKEMEIKKDQLYALYDVLEGQKQAQQEMTDEFLDLTLTQLGVVVDDTWEGID
ncbi:BgTH12-03831 [Blumeria graminis f. sp. triticale]|uniref:Bgt-2206-2 n=4 Tax=Blumeria graminis TaxID=34373 RepID=A0A9X9L8X2_BLUGR|nr:BgTH12-03831 [Blumeria graminis f. sp. triticale]VCU39891.1 Bgt-2206-2 [Blumeria graminis f. sp. tritici]